MKNNVIKICSSFLIASLVLAFSACYTAQDGLSAYEIAVKNGFVGSESEWIESLKGKDGIDGENGINGIDGKDGVNGKDGIDGSNGTNGKDGIDGVDGISITDVKFDAEGNLIVTFSNGQTVNAGNPDKYAGDTSSSAPVLSETNLNIVSGSTFIINSDRPYCKFESSDTSVLRVSDGGVVVALGEGSCTVTVTSRDGKSSVCKVNVVCFDYRPLADGTLEITGYNGSSKNVNIPENINGIPVSSIGESAFADFFEEVLIESVTIPDSVKTIGSYAFSSCIALHTVNFGANIEYIGNSAFSGCVKLKSIALPKKLTSLEGAVFNSCESLTSVTIHDSITKIGGSAFYGCVNLKDLTIGKSVTYIDTFAFGDCKSLESVTIPESVGMLGEYAFSGCSKLEDVIFVGKTSYFNNTFEDSPYFDKMEHPDTVLTNDYVWATGSVTIRTAPSLDSTVFGYASIGDKFFRLGTVEAEEVIWAKVEIDGQYYYISMKYLSTVEISA